MQPYLRSISRIRCWLLIGPICLLGLGLGGPSNCAAEHRGRSLSFSIQRFSGGQLGPRTGSSGMVRGGVSLQRNSHLPSRPSQVKQGVVHQVLSHHGHPLPGVPRLPIPVGPQRGTAAQQIVRQAVTSAVPDRVPAAWWAWQQRHGQGRYGGYAWHRPRPPVLIYLPATFVCPPPVLVCPGPPAPVCPPPAVVVTGELSLVQPAGGTAKAGVAGPIDLKVEYLELVELEGSEPGAGPLYRLWIHNLGGSPINQPFDVALIAAQGDRPGEDSPFATVRIERLAAATRVSVEIRLPAESLQMGMDAEGAPVPFQNLFAAVDALSELSETDEQNNTLSLARTAIPAATGLVAAR